MIVGIALMLRADYHMQTAAAHKGESSWSSELSDVFENTRQLLAMRHSLEGDRGHDTIRTATSLGR
jgi:hypothetical protein